MNTAISNLLSKTSAIPVKYGVAGFVFGNVAAIIHHKLNNPIEMVVPAEPRIVVDEEIGFTDQQLLDFMNAEKEADMIAEMDRLKADERAAKLMLEKSEHIELVSDESVAEGTRVNVFMAPTDDDWDYELELSQRDPELPYTLHVDEYLSDEMGYKQETVTYYAGDDIMADLHDVPIYNWSAFMGALNWGHGSKDKNVVYIRNEKLHREWEVLLHRGSFEVEVLGLQMEHGGELKHSHQHTIRKFRDD
jgi:hypothetical protein